MSFFLALFKCLQYYYLLQLCLLNLSSRGILENKFTFSATFSFYHERKFDIGLFLSIAMSTKKFANEISIITHNTISRLKMRTKPHQWKCRTYIHYHLSFWKILCFHFLFIVWCLFDSLILWSTAPFATQSTRQSTAFVTNTSEDKKTFHNRMVTGTVDLYDTLSYSFHLNVKQTSNYLRDLEKVGWNCKRRKI